MNARAFLPAAALAVAAALPAAAQEPVLDNHYIDSAEVFVAPTEAPEGGWQVVAIARMLQQPSAQTRGEGQFLIVGPGAGYNAGQRVWTRFWWRTRVATAEDVRLGKLVFVPDLPEGGVYRQPNDRQESLGAGWWMAPITDVTDLYKREVTCAGEYHVGLGAMRVTR